MVIYNNAKVEEAERWLTCNCNVCQLMRRQLGKERIEKYIKLLKGE